MAMTGHFGRSSMMLTSQKHRFGYCDPIADHKTLEPTDGRTVVCEVKELLDATA
jgi:hypothetical protein